MIEKSFSINDEETQKTKGFNPGSLRGSTITMLGTIVSAGTVTLPYAFKLVGIIPGVILLIIGW